MRHQHFPEYEHYCRQAWEAGKGALQIATTYNNDGLELWLGTGHRWHVFYSARQARRLAWFILWDWWAKSTWFGLKRKLWYWGLKNKMIQDDKRAWIEAALADGDTIGISVPAGN